MPPWKERSEAMLTIAPPRLPGEGGAGEGLGEEEDRLEVDVDDRRPSRPR